MAGKNVRKFIPLSDDKEKKDSKNMEALKNAAVSISMQGSIVLGLIHKDPENYLELQSQLSLIKDKVEFMLAELRNKNNLSIDEFYANNLPKVNTISNVSTIESFFTSDELDEISHSNESRQLPNGGLAPPKIWDKDLDSSEKNFILTEARRMHKEGKTIIKHKFQDKLPVSIEEFTESFAYLDNIHDYNGSLLVSLLKNKSEIDSQEINFKVNLEAEKEGCKNGNTLILSVYDIQGSVDIEQKKFLIVLKFDKNNGQLYFKETLFNKGEYYILSNRQKEEINKFCKIKKIIY